MYEPHRLPLTAEGAEEADPAATFKWSFFRPMGPGASLAWQRGQTGSESDSIIAASFEDWRTHRFPPPTRHALTVRPEWRSVERVGGFVRSLLEASPRVGRSWMSQKLRQLPPELPPLDPLPPAGQPAGSHRERILFIDPCALTRWWCVSNLHAEKHAPHVALSANRPLHVLR